MKIRKAVYDLGMIGRAKDAELGHLFRDVIETLEHDPTKRFTVRLGLDYDRTPVSLVVEVVATDPALED